MLAEELALLVAPLVLIHPAPHVPKSALIEPQLAFQQKHQMTRSKGVTNGQPDTRSQAGILDHDGAVRDEHTAGKSQHHEHHGGKDHEPDDPRKGARSGSVCYHDYEAFPLRDNAHPLMLLAQLAAGILL